MFLSAESRLLCENVKSAALEEHLLSKKKKKRKHREDKHGDKKVRYVRNKAVQTVPAGLGEDPAPPLHLDRGTAGGPAKQEPGRETCSSSSGGPHLPYLDALKLGRVPFLSHQDHYIRSSCLPTASQFGRLMHQERQANGGGAVLHAYADELAGLGPAQMEAFAQDFLRLAFAEEPRGAATYALAVVHGAAAYLPDFLDYFAFNFPNTPVKMELLGKKDIETTTIANFHSQVRFWTRAVLTSWYMHNFKDAFWKFSVANKSDPWP